MSSRTLSLGEIHAVIAFLGAYRSLKATLPDSVLDSCPSIHGVEGYMAAVILYGNADAESPQAPPEYRPFAPDEWARRIFTTVVERATGLEYRVTDVGMKVCLGDALKLTAEEMLELFMDVEGNPLGVAL